MSRHRPLALAVSLLAALACAPAALAADARYESISTDGKVAFFSTVDQLVPGDTDFFVDIYERSFDPVGGDEVTRLVSTGPSGGNDGRPADFYGADAAGHRALFLTAERLTPDDTDDELDIYMRDLVVKETIRISRGAAACEATGCGNGEHPANMAVGGAGGVGGIALDGERVLFTTAEQLSADDTDDEFDIYARDLSAGVGGETVLVSQGGASCAAQGCGDGPHPVSFQGASEDGLRVAFTTAEGLADGDDDSSPDVYLRDWESGETLLVSLPGPCPEGKACNPSNIGISADGSWVMFETDAQLDPADEDARQDVYAWSEGSVTLASSGPAGDNGDFAALYLDFSSDRDTVFFHTTESLTTDDGDAGDDVYAHDLGTGTTTLVSRADPSCGGCGDGDSHAELPPGGVVPEGATVFFLSEEQLAVGDEDEAADVYARDLEAGTTTRVSAGSAACAAQDCGNGSLDAHFAGASANGARAFVATDEPLALDDADGVADVYERFGGTTTLISTGSLPGSGLHGADLHAVAADGSRAFFVTEERLTVDDDFKGEADVYARSGGITLLISTGNGNGELEEKLGPPKPALTGTDPASPGAATAIRVRGSAEAGAAIKLYRNSSDCSGFPVATGNAAELAAPGLAVTVPSGSASAFRATAEADGIISPCSEPLAYTHSPSTPEPDPDPDPGDPGPGPGGPGGGSGSDGGGPGDGGPARTHGGGIPYAAPLTRITFAPAGKTRVRRPVFRFTDSTGQPGTSFRCKLDRQRWRGCSSPVRLKKLGKGRHVFMVKGVNAVGAWEARPVQRSFRLVGGRR